MPATLLYVRIKKGYAAAIIKDLQKLDAIELLDDAPVPQWQKKEVRTRLKELQKNPSKALNWNEASKKIKQLAK
ncbi:MAG: addiction module protein [Bacteroidota bacterium]|nr:addiction module protein [Bacteroidota bacterium]